MTPNFFSYVSISERDAVGWGTALPCSCSSVSKDSLCPAPSRSALMLVDASFLPCSEDAGCLFSPLSGAGPTHGRTFVPSWTKPMSIASQRDLPVFLDDDPDLPALIRPVLEPTCSSTALTTPMLTPIHDKIVVLFSRDSITALPLGAACVLLAFVLLRPPTIVVSAQSFAGPLSLLFST